MMKLVFTEKSSPTKQSCAMGTAQPKVGNCTRLWDIHKNKPMKPMYFLLLGLILLNCSKDDDGRLKREITGSVMGPVSCGTEGMGPAYGIVPDNFALPSGFIITATLPDEFKKEGLKIHFDMIPSKKYITHCTANFFPDQFYEVFHVELLEDQK